MNYETTLRALLDDAAPALRASLKEAVIATLVDDQRGAVFDLLRKAYDLGYREALANARTQVAPATQVASASPSTHETNSVGVAVPPPPSNDAGEDDDLEPELPGSDLFSSAPDPADVEDEDAPNGDIHPTTSDSAEDNENETPVSVTPPSDEERSDVNWNLLDDRTDRSPSAATRVAQREPPRLRVRSSLTIGSLRDRIFKVFELDRFDIDVVVCRKGDKNRRQLKSTVRLSKYEVQG